MNRKNRLANFIPNIFLVLALIGFIILWLMIGGKRYNQTVPTEFDLFRLLAMVFGIVLILPYIIFLFTSKSKSRTKLQGNKKNQLISNNNFNVFVLNESNQTLIINRNAELANNQWHIFEMNDFESINFSNGIVFEINKDNNLEVQDFRSQVTGLGDDYYNKYKIPDYVHWAFIIVEPNKGDKSQ